MGLEAIEQEERHSGQRAWPLGASGSSSGMQSPCFRLCQAGGGKRAFCHHPAPRVWFVYSRPELQTFFHLFPLQWLPLPRPRCQASAPPRGPKAGGGVWGGTFPTKLPCLSPSASAITYLSFSVSLTLSVCLSPSVSLQSFCACISVSLFVSVSISQTLWAYASVSLTQEFRALVFQSWPCPDSLHGLSPLSSPNLPWPLSTGNDNGTDRLTGPL